MIINFMRTWKSNIALDIEKVNILELEEKFQAIVDGENPIYKDNRAAIRDATRSLSKSTKI